MIRFVRLDGFDRWDRYFRFDGLVPYAYWVD
jgi:hypothetical protein